MGDAGGRVPPSRVSVPSSRFSVPHRELGVPPSRFERLMSRRKRPNSSPNFGEKPLQFSAKTFFIFGFHLILTKKNTSITGEDIFWCSFNFGDKIT